MRYLQFIILLGWWWLAGRAFAMIMPQGPGRHLQWGFDSLRVQQTDMDREARSSYFLSYRAAPPLPWTDSLPWSVPLADSLSWEGWFMTAPDNKQKSKLVDVRQHFYSLFATLSYQSVALCRYAVSAGPGLTYERVTSKLIEARSSHHVFVPSFMLRFVVDYALSPRWEVSLHLGFLQRFSQDKRDWSYGLGLNHNL